MGVQQERLNNPDFELSSIIFCDTDVLNYLDLVCQIMEGIQKFELILKNQAALYLLCFPIFHGLLTWSKIPNDREAF